MPKQTSKKFSKSIKLEIFRNLQIVKAFRKYFFILIPSIFLAACNTSTLNQVSVKKITNETTGEIEEYRSIKILEDEENNYFLDIKIPEGYEEAPAQYGSFLTVYRFSKGEANQYTHEAILISKTNSPQINNIEYYAKWMDSSYLESQGKPIFKDSSQGYEISNNKLRIKNQINKYIFPCWHMKPGSICFEGQKGITMLKVLKPNETIWSISYLNLINPLNNSNYEKTVKEKFEEGEKIIENCCKIIAVKKP